MTYIWVLAPTAGGLRRSRGTTLRINAEQTRRRLGQQDLTAVAGRHHLRHAVEHRTEMVALPQLGFAGRDPMYTGALLVGAGTPLVLGSWWGLLLSVLAGSAYLTVRILDEEMLLKSDLPGYTEYIRRVRYRLVPHVW